MRVLKECVVLDVVIQFESSRKFWKECVVVVRNNESEGAAPIRARGG